MFKIGDFSRISRVSAKTLRFYDEMELLKPVQVDHLNGYRYYSLEQLPRLNRILALRDLGFTLDQIRALLDERIALRSDFRGRGDSEGATIDITPGGDLGDATAALDYLEHQPDVDSARLALVGHSWGGDVAILLAGRDRRVSNTVLWNTAINVHEWDPPFEEVDGRQVLALFGNLVGNQFYAATRNIDLIQALRQANGPFLIVQSEADEAVPSAEFDRLKNALDQHRIAYEWSMIAGADHAFMHHVWERTVIARTVEWLSRSLAV